MPGMDGEQTLEALKKEHPWMEVVILTGHGSVDSAVECTKIGAWSYLQKPCELDRLLSVLTDAYKKKVMNKMNIKEHRMNELLEMSQYSSPKAILERIREFDKEDDMRKDGNMTTIRVLLVDDEAEFLTFLKSRLENRGLTVFAAASGLDA